jgi:predicted deacylase
VKPFNSIFLLICSISIWSCETEKEVTEAPLIRSVNTETLPIQLQYKGIFDLGDSVFLSNDYAGARMSGVARTNDTLITVFVGPENAPVNMSPWYSFKIWSKSEQRLYVKLTYPAHARHRYYPKLSRNGRSWEHLDSSKFEVEIETFEDKSVPVRFTMQVDTGPDTLWISAQEWITLEAVEDWMNRLIQNPFVSDTIIGESTEGRPIHLITIGESESQKNIMIISRQHPPEVTGFLAMQAFVETLCSDTELAENFRTGFNTYVVPMVNPDGVYHGHWRHNFGGIDLNRDWKDFNQPETIAIRDFMKKKTAKNNQKFELGIDFHSTWQDVYYINPKKQQNSSPGIVRNLIEEIASEFSGYEPEIQPLPQNSPPISSQHFFLHEMGAESFTYEVGDNTPRKFVHQKGRVTAQKLMKLMLDKHP